MNNGRIAIMSACNIAGSTIWAMNKLRDKGFEVTIINEENVPPVRPNIVSMNQLEMDPIILEPYEPNRIFSSKHYRDESYYSKRIAKRRGKNRNKKTHRNK